MKWTKEEEEDVLLCVGAAQAERHQGDEGDKVAGLQVEGSIRQLLQGCLPFRFIYLLYFIPYNPIY